MISILKLSAKCYPTYYILKANINHYKRDKRQIMSYLCSPHKRAVEMREVDLEKTWKYNKSKLCNAVKILEAIKNNSHNEEVQNSFLLLWEDEDTEIIV